MVEVRERGFLSTAVGAALLLFVATEAAPQTGELRGRAAIEVVLETGPLRRRAESDRQGPFRIFDLPSGAYSVTVESCGRITR
jgi:hypothetical protein